MKSSNNNVKTLVPPPLASEFLGELLFWGDAAEFKKAITELLYAFAQTPEDLGEQEKADVIYYTKGLSMFVDKLEDYQKNIEL